MANGLLLPQCAEYYLEFTNLSGHACTLAGYPGVSAVGLSGGQLGSPAGWGDLDHGQAGRRSGRTFMRRQRWA
jgi:hypothetical protein